MTNPASILIDRYVIYRRAGNGAFEALQEIVGSTVDGSSWIYNDTFLEPGTGYTYRIVALTPWATRDRRVQRCHDLSDGEWPR